MSDEKEKRVVFAGESFQMIVERAWYIRNLPGARLEIHGKGNETTIQFVAEGYEGPPINDAFVCPGSPRCP